MRKALLGIASVWIALILSGCGSGGSSHQLSTKEIRSDATIDGYVSFNPTAAR
jgi:ABC-type Zn uptake system ZnuABC Zn-binding protein ZnuA